MRGRDHLGLSVITGFIIVTPWLVSDSLASIIFLMALSIGSILPDADSSERYAKYKNSIVMVADLLTERVFYPIIAYIFKTNKRHRGILHTIYAIIILSLFLTILTIIPYYLISRELSLNIVIIFLGFLIGGILHLAEDACTVTGVKPLYPYNQKRFFGTMNTFDVKNELPKTFIKLGSFVFVFLILGGIIMKLNHITMIFITILSLVLLWSFFFIVSGLKIK